MLASLAIIVTCLGVVLSQTTLLAESQLTVINHSGHSIDLFWIDIYNESPELAKQNEESAIRDTKSFEISSFDTHMFVIKLHNPPNELEDVEIEFTKGPIEETVHVYFDSETNELSIKQVTVHDDWLNRIKASTDKCASSIGVRDEYAQCVTREIFPEVDKLQVKHNFMKEHFNRVANNMRNYTCADDSLNTSTAIDSFIFPHNDVDYRIETLLNKSHAKIWLAYDMISDDECAFLREKSQGKLTRAVIAGDDGNPVVSETRKAQQAHYSLPLDNWETDFLWPLYHRTLTFANEIGGMDVHRPGQEDFTIIQYDPSDEYMPHCDGDCEGEAHIPGGRVATAVFYCTVPTKGGATTFSKADVLVRPKKNAAAIFTYKGEDGHMDLDGYTEHSGCPVLEGDKWITTIWMREGVTRERSWKDIDPSGYDVEPQDDTPRTDRLNHHMLLYTVGGFCLLICGLFVWLAFASGTKNRRAY